MPNTPAATSSRSSCGSPGRVVASERERTECAGAREDERLAERVLSRRSLLRGALVLSASSLLSSCDQLEEAFGPTPVPAPTKVGIDMARVAEQAAVQQCPMWCWAAAASMIFGFHGRQVSQAQIVTRAYGAPVCAPAVSTSVMGRSLSGQYVDAAGRTMNSQVTAAYDYYNGFNTLSNAGIVQLLGAGRPLLYANRNHAMVVYELTYSGSAANPNVLSVNVIDPWPSNPRVRPLSAVEMGAASLGGDMTFLAAVSVV